MCWIVSSYFARNSGVDAFRSRARVFSSSSKASRSRRRAIAASVSGKIFRSYEEDVPGTFIAT